MRLSSSFGPILAVAYFARAAPTASPDSHNLYDDQTKRGVDEISVQNNLQLRDGSDSMTGSVQGFPDLTRPSRGSAGSKTIAISLGSRQQNGTGSQHHSFAKAYAMRRRSDSRIVEDFRLTSYEGYSVNTENFSVHRLSQYVVSISVTVPVTSVQVIIFQPQTALERFLYPVLVVLGLHNLTPWGQGPRWEPYNNNFMDRFTAMRDSDAYVNIVFERPGATGMVAIFQEDMRSGRDWADSRGY